MHAIQQVDKLIQLAENEDKDINKMLKTFKNHSKDRELDEFEEDLTQGKIYTRKST